MANTGNAVINADIFHAAMAQFQDLLVQNEQLLNDLNVYPVPDSDTGSNSLQTLKAGLASAASQTGDLNESALAIATGAAKSAMGNSGVIWPWLAVWLPNALFVPVAYLFYRFAQQ